MTLRDDEKIENQSDAGKEKDGTSKNTVEHERESKKSKSLSDGTREGALCCVDAIGKSLLVKGSGHSNPAMMFFLEDLIDFCNFQPVRRALAI